MKKITVTLVVVFLLFSLIAPSTYAETLIKVGSRGAEVTRMQQRLNELGFNAGPIDGIAGPATQSAVISFQKANNLMADGIAGPQTLGRLYMDNFTAKTEDKQTMSASITSTLKQGSRGNQVKVLQQRLNELGYNAGTPDGIYGARTRNAVATFQRINGMSSDGIAGYMTVNRLYGTPQGYSKSQDSSASGLEIVNFAKLYLGKPYVYAASGPNSFDCSGYTSFVYKNFGVQIPRVAADQRNAGYGVSKTELLPGDLILFTSPNSGSSIGHCGIYIGDGNFIHASSGSSMCVRIDTLNSGSYAKRYVTARRIIN